MKLIEMHVNAIAMDRVSGEPIVILNDDEKKRALPIWVGLLEARAISLAMKKERPPRPLTHELFLSTVKELGYELTQIEINELDSQTFKATLVLESNSEETLKTLRIDSRPSDAIALATIEKCPVLVAVDVLDRACVELSYEDEKEESERKEFQDFLKDLKASDFKLQTEKELEQESFQPGPDEETQT